jgi:uncharacterized protein YjbI with pentapeptide repeats
VLRPRNGKWQAEAFYNSSCATYSKVGSIQAVVAELRNKRGDADAEITLKVEEGARLSGVDVLALIEVNGGSHGLDLSRCWMDDVDLDYETVQRERETYADMEGADPPWVNSDNGGVDLRGAKLQEAKFREARLRGALLNGADLGGALLGGADLQGADLSMANMQKAKFTDFDRYIANLRGANLRGARLQGANLFRVDLREVADFRYAQLRGAHLRGARLEEVDLYDVGSLTGAHFYGAYLDRTRLRQDQLGDAVGEEIGARDKSHREASEALEEVFSWPEDGLPPESGDRKSAQNLPEGQPGETFHGSTYETAAETYLNLKNNFASIGRYEDAVWAHTKERQMKKLGYFQEWRWKSPDTWINLFLWARNWLYELSTGYGERPWRPVACSVIVVLLFAGAYTADGLIDPAFDGNPKTPPRPPNLLDALTYSIGAFFTVGFNTMEPLGGLARLLTSIESALGIGLLALLIWTLGNSMTRA